MKQQTLSSSIEASSAAVTLSQKDISQKYSEFCSLTIPSYSDARFNASNWFHFITETSKYEAKEIRTQYDSELSANQDSILAGIQLYHGDSEAVFDAFTIVSENETGKEWLDEKVVSFVTEFGKRFVFAPLVANWVPAIYICDKNSYLNRVSYDSSGYYHPTQHWIAVQYDSGDPQTKYWSVSSEAPKPYESSVTLHELGHAVHYLFTAHITDCESIDNSEKTSETAVLSYTSQPRTDWQQSFCKMARDGYFSLLDGEVRELSLWTQKLTVEEYLAESFVAYITAPRWLQQKQPTAYTAYNRVCTP